MFRIGQGYDIHRFTPAAPLRLGGCLIADATHGLLGHSDADALIHAIIDAILGALALGDIGQWFPDSDDAWRGADSAALLRKVLADSRVEPWHVVNLDCTVITQRPRLAMHIPAIRHSIADILNAPFDAISVKAKTKERLDAVGQGLALEAWAVILLER